MSQDKLRVGIVGLGAIGGWHVQAFGKNPKVEILAICDHSPEWLAHCQKSWGTRYAFSSWAELIACDELDAVSVCLPTVYHAPVAVAALAAGKHVLCEKPMTVNAAKAREMAAAARSSGKTLMISYNQRFGADIQYLKRHIEAGALGEIYFVRTGWRRPMGCLPPARMGRATGEYNRNWFNEKDMGGGVLWDLGSHVVDLALYLMGFPRPTEMVGAVYTRFLPEHLNGTGLPADADDHAVGFVRFEGGSSMQVEASFGSYVEDERVFQALCGDQGGAHRETGAPLKLFSKASGAYVTITPRIGESTMTPMDHFVDCVLTGSTPIVTPDQGVAVTEILEGIYASGLAHRSG